jgi:hypothetical protein
MNNNNSMAQLSAWTDAMSKNTKSAPRAPERKREHDPINYDGNFLDAGRELRANSSIERMETWTESMKRNPASIGKS